ncbi:MAG TPA: ATPase domain-containing protein [Gammaproteobacteria bacterium]|nr:ATPase domain-containing protein [Gammaproteobacteria bacterium]
MMAARETAATGIPGLDDILDGGFTRDRVFLVEGVPGSGKTTLGLQFLMQGAAAGEPVLYVTLSETENEIRGVADSHGWSLDGIEICDLTPSEGALSPEDQNTLFHPSELELAETSKRILEDVERLKPKRLVLDSLSELKMLAGNALRYRRHILALKQLFATRACTVLLLDDVTVADRDLQMQSIAHGVVLLEQLYPDYGVERRRVRVVKYRGVRFRGGNHDYVIRTGGLRVFPRLVAAEHRHTTSRRRRASGVEELDALMGGGIEEGTSTLIVGSAGTGKSTLAAQFLASAAAEGVRGAIFMFDESPQTLLTRCAEIGIDLEPHVAKGVVTLQQVDPAELTPGELTHSMKDAVTNGARIVVVDSLNGYLNAMPGERFLTIQLHELLAYLSQQGVATILIGAHQGMIGTQMHTPIDASYLADAVVMLRYFEARGEVRQAISVVKKRGGRHERTIREFRLDSGGIKVGEALRQFRGVLTGVPTYEGGPAPLLEAKR